MRHLNASVVELADALDSGSSGSDPVQVQLLSLAPGGIAQLVRALASHARGRRFESYCLYQKRIPQNIVVSAFLCKQTPRDSRGVFYKNARTDHSARTYHGCQAHNHSVHTELAGSAPSTPIRMPRKPFRVLIVYAVFLKKSIGK